MLKLIAVRRWCAALVATLGIVFGLVPSALALDGHPVEGKDYAIMHGPNKASTYVRVAEKTNVNTPLFAEAMHTTPFDIRSDNPTKTLALCKRPGDGYEMGNGINTPEKRASNVVWQNCPEERRYVYLVPGETLELTGVHHLSFDEEQQVLRDLRKCEDAPCVSANLKKLDVRVAIAPASAGQAPPAPSPQPVTVVAQPTASAPPVVSSASPTAVGESVQPIVALDTARKLRELEELADARGSRNVLFGMSALFLLAVCLVLARENRSNSRAAARAVETVRENLKRTAQDLGKSKADAEKVVAEVKRELEERGREFRRVFRDREEARKDLEAEAAKRIAREDELAGVRVTLTERDHELARITAAFDSLRDVQKRQNDDFRRCGELYRQRAEYKPRLIRVDNAITELTQSRGRLLEQYEEMTRQGDPDAGAFYDMLMRLDEQLRIRHEARQGILAVLPDEQEFQELHERLAGFRLDTDAFYVEAQRDRNDAAQALGEAEAKFLLATSRQERLVKEREAFRAEKEKTSAELAGREEQCRDREFQLRRLMGDLLEALGYDPNLPLEEIAKLDGASGLLHEARKRVEAITNERDEKDADLRRAIADLDAAREAGDEATRSVRGLHLELEGVRDAAQAEIARLTEAAARAETQSAPADSPVAEDGPVDTFRGLSPAGEGQPSSLDLARDLNQTRNDLAASQMVLAARNEEIVGLHERCAALIRELEERQHSAPPAEQSVVRPRSEEQDPIVEVREVLASISPDAEGEEERTRPRVPTLRPGFPSVSEFASPLYDPTSRERGAIFANLDRLVAPFEHTLFRVATGAELQLLRRFGLVQVAAYDAQGADIRFQVWQLHDQKFTDQVHVMRRAVAT